MPVNAPIRASDTDRDHTLAQLQEHYAAGRLTAEEHQDRTSAALVARTLGELGELLADLPATGPVAGALARRDGPAGSPPARPARADGTARPRPAAAVAGLGVIVALYALTGLLTGIWWIPWAVIIIPAARAISYARHRRAAVRAA